MPIHSQTKYLLKNNVFSYLVKNSKRFSILSTLPLLAACQSVLTITPTPNPNPTPTPTPNQLEDSQLIAAGYNLYRAPSNAPFNFTGGYGHDAILGGEGNDTLSGAAGKDYIKGNGGNDTLDGGIGADKLFGGSGNDILKPGYDFDYDYIDGGSGIDTVDYSSHYGLLNINLLTNIVKVSDVYQDKLLNIENVQGAINGSNNIFGSNDSNALYGGNLNDEIYGNDGHDVLDGGKGNDKLVGGKGNDELFGQDGRDSLYGSEGNDALYGHAGDDLLFGGDDNDNLSGGAGDDQLDGGRGSDILVGGAGTDTFIISDFDVTGLVSTDRIKDFNKVDDLINFAQLSHINSYNDYLAYASQEGANVEISLATLTDHKLIIENIAVNDLTIGDFMFV